MILHKLFKHGFRQEFNVHTTNNIDNKPYVKEAKDIKLDFCMSIETITLFMAFPSMAMCELT
jgi:hypothetical protein